MRGTEPALLPQRMGFLPAGPGEVRRMSAMQVASRLVFVNFYLISLRQAVARRFLLHHRF